MDPELAYLAGFIDGEGSIAVGLNRSNKGVRRWYLRFSCHQLDPRPLLVLSKRFGGSVRRHSNRARPIYEWAIMSKMAAQAIADLRPMLIVKAEQADVALEFQELMSTAPAGYRPHLSGDEEAARHDCYERLRALKQLSYNEISVPMPEPRPVRPKRAPKVRTSFRKPVVSAQGRVGRPVKGHSRKPAAIDLDVAYRELGIADTARLYGTSRQTIYNWLDSYGIARQGYSAEAKQRRSAAIARTWKEPDETLSVTLPVMRLAGRDNSGC